jgi:hypothetical protein
MNRRACLGGPNLGDRNAGLACRRRVQDIAVVEVPVATLPAMTFRIVGPGDHIGDGTSPPLEIADIQPHDPRPGSDPDLIRLLVDLQPAPPQHERWWWRRRISLDRNVVMGANSDQVHRAIIERVLRADPPVDERRQPPAE